MAEKPFLDFSRQRERERTQDLDRTRVNRRSQSLSAWLQQHNDHDNGIADGMSCRSLHLGRLSHSRFRLAEEIRLRFVDFIHSNEVLQPKKQSKEDARRNDEREKYQHRQTTSIQCTHTHTRTSGMQFTRSHLLD